MTAQDTHDRPETETGPPETGPPEGDESAAADVAPEADSANPASPEPEAGVGGRARISPLVAVLTALCLAAAVCAAWSGWTWYRAAHAAPSAHARLRDQVLEQGEQAVQNFNTLDYRNVSKGIGLWLSSSTGALHTEVAQGRAQFVQQVRKSKTTTTARVLDAALTRLNIRAGTASLIVALQITVVPSTGRPVVKLNRLSATLARTSHGWLLTGIGQVPVGGAGTGG
ncbi:MAG TPA: hypothetical protein VGG25_07385 [Streptosporangiaceae bacterium]|jgi:Mce-associated membrane protein